MDKPQKADLTSMDVADDKRRQLAQLFPEVVTETRTEDGKLVHAVDYERLKGVLGEFSEILENQRERYGMTWPGKNECLKIIQQPSIATLKPCREESVNFDDTENVFIEGDNLEALKLLQKAYYGKVKMIYIDPPYNTGGDFIYPDDYSETLDTYLAYTGQIDDEGRRFSTNTDSEGRYHSKWLRMMSPRLYLARNLLADDGTVFISIDDHEDAHLRNLCDEIFGEENFINTISVNMKNIAGASGGGEDKRLKKNVEYIHVYAKNYGEFASFDNAYEYVPIAELVESYREEGKSWKYTSVLVEQGEKLYIGSTVDGDGNDIKIYARKNPVIKSVAQLMTDEGLSESEVYSQYSAKIFQTAMPQSSIRPRVMAKAKELGSSEDIHSIEYVPKSGRNKGLLYEQFYKGDNFRLFAWLRDVSEERDGVLCKKELQGTYWDYASETKNLTKEGNMPFQNGKKPVAMLRRILAMQPDKDCIVMDFFAGSASTAHAVLEQNKDDGGKRRFIMVQLPEECDPTSDVYKEGFRKVSDVGKERLRRVLSTLTKEQTGTLDLHGTGTMDLGFRIFSLDRSNFRLWDGAQPGEDPEKIAKQLELHEQHIDPNATQEDILYELLLKAGFPLTTKVEKVEMAGKDLFSIAEGALLICLQDEITKELIKAMADADPLQVICLDSGFKNNDQLKANAVQTFKARNRGKDKESAIVFRTV